MCLSHLCCEVVVRLSRLALPHATCDPTGKVPSTAHPLAGAGGWHCLVACAACWHGQPRSSRAAPACRAPHRTSTRRLRAAHARSARRAVCADAMPAAACSSRPRRRRRRRRCACRRSTTSTAPTPVSPTCSRCAWGLFIFDHRRSSITAHGVLTRAPASDTAVCTRPGATPSVSAPPLAIQLPLVARFAELLVCRAAARPAQPRPERGAQTEVMPRAMRALKRALAVRNPVAGNLRLPRNCATSIQGSGECVEVGPLCIDEARRDVLPRPVPESFYDDTQCAPSSAACSGAGSR